MLGDTFPRTRMIFGTKLRNTHRAATCLTDPVRIQLHEELWILCHNFQVHTIRENYRSRLHSVYRRSKLEFMAADATVTRIKAVKSN